MPDMDDFHAFISTSGGGSDGGSGKWDFGCGWVVIVFVALLLIELFISGFDWVIMDRILGWGIIAFFFARSLFR